MAYNRDDRPRDSRWSPDADRGPRGGYSHDDERGFLDRARDEIGSWFGDDEAERRRAMDDRSSGRERGENRSRFSGSGGRDAYRSDRYDRSRMVEDGYRPYTGRSSERGESRGEMRGESRGQYRPMTGDYGRSDREDERGFTGMASTARPASSQDRSAMPAHDRHYSEWRQRQIDEIDRDYDDYRREHQSKFESEFSSWRQGRQGKRQLLGQVREHMEVVGSDDQPVGKIDHIRRDRVILTKSDSDDGRHHPVGCSMFERVEDDKLYLNVPAEEAKAKMMDESRGRALGEREDSGSEGPHILDRSFSGTY